MFSCTVKVGRRLKNWKAKPIFFNRNSERWASFSFVISFPNNFTMPPSGDSRNPRILISVDLPTPDLPRIQIKSPCLICRLMPLSTFVGPKLLCTSDSSI